MKTLEAADIAWQVLSAAEGLEKYKKLTADERLMVLEVVAGIQKNMVTTACTIEAMRRAVSNLNKEKP